MSYSESQARFSRFKDASWFPEKSDLCLIGGAGGIGSWLALLLARAGFNVEIHDHDLFEAHNMSGQFVSADDIHKSKVLSLKANIHKFASGSGVTAVSNKITATSPTHYWAFSGFDNMEARAIMFKSWKEEFGNDPKAIFIDGRLLMEQLQIYCVVGNSQYVELYQSTALFHDSEVADAVCTLKQTSHSAAMIAAHMVGFFTNHIHNIRTGSLSRSVPYYWEYFIPLDMLDTDN